MMVGFFFYEHYSPVERAALPTRVWFYPNFAIWTAMSLFPYTWFTAAFLQLTSYWQDTFKWDPIITAVHFLPFGLTAFLSVFFLSTYLQRKLSDKKLVTLEGVLIVTGTILFAFIDRPSRYWSFGFPALIIGANGAALFYAHVNISVFKSTPASQSGVVGAILNSAFQLGSAVGAAATTAIQTNVDSKQPDPSTSYKGRQAAFWFLLGVIVVEVIAFLIFFKEPSVPAGGDSGPDLNSKSIDQSGLESPKQENKRLEKSETFAFEV